MWIKYYSRRHHWPGPGTAPSFVNTTGDETLGNGDGFKGKSKS